ncbi:MAG TPA: cell wall hydrolase [Allosphingosinicella sp.]|jgi:spore germination cell wall hydrolase CwlJ-like protein
MKGVVAGGLVAVSIVVGAQAQGGDGRNAPADPKPHAPAVWSAWTRPLGASTTPASPAPEAAPSSAEAPTAEIDVVDARWMAMTIWGEARGGGEAAMRAVGHVIANRSRAGLRSRYVTDTVSEAFQFSCWNAGDPNREAMLDVDSLRPGSRDHAMWLIAKALAEEILSGRRGDPTGGALFYHTTAVSPRWSRGVAPTRLIGNHIFFRNAR